MLEEEAPCDRLPVDHGLTEYLLIAADQERDRRQTCLPTGSSGNNKLIRREEETAEGAAYGLKP